MKRMKNDISTPKLTEMFYLCVFTMPVYTVRTYMYAEIIIKKVSVLFSIYTIKWSFFFLSRKDFRMYVLTPKHHFRPVYNPVKWSSQKATNLVSNTSLSSLIELRVRLGSCKTGLSPPVTLCY